MRPKLVIIGLFIVLGLLIYASAEAATFKEARLTPGGLFLYTLEVGGKNIYCIEPISGQDKVICWNDDNDLFECEVLTPDMGFIGVCT